MHNDFEFSKPNSLIDDEPESGQKDAPLITVITAVYNAVETIESLILSVINQTHQNIQLIIIDGGSTDGTVAILKKYDRSINFWVSEKDNGIYDALNKGLDKCIDGSYVLVLGADDKLLNLDPVIEKIITCQPDVVVTNVRQRDLHTNKLAAYKCYLPDKISETNFLRFPLHHQGFMFKYREASQLVFNLKAGLHADYELMIRLTNSSKNSLYVDIELAEYATGGASDYFSFKNLRSLNDIAVLLKYSRVKLIYCSPLSILRMLAKILLSKNLTNILRSMKRK